jgi:hypothetical protein
VVGDGEEGFYILDFTFYIVSEMRVVGSTAEILLAKHFNKSVGEKLKDWAYEMINAGFDSEHLIELAGIEKPYNQFELESLTTKVFDELQLDYSNREKIINDFVNYICEQVLEKEGDLLKSLRTLKELYLDMDCNDLQEFALLYWAKEDLNYGEAQHYWPEGDRTTIDKIILDYFKAWKSRSVKINE